MSHVRKLFSVLILLLNHEAKTLGSPRIETWKALLSTTRILLRIKHGSNPTHDEFYDSIKRNEGMDQFVLSPVSPAEKHSLDTLPTELIQSILCYIEDQETIYNLLLLNRRMKNLIQPTLYRHPYLTSPLSINSFLQMAKTNNRDPKSISFGPTKVGVLSPRKQPFNSFKVLSCVHSGLFNYLIHDRESTASQELVHPIFYAFARITSSSTVFEEYVMNKEKKIANPIREPFMIKDFEISRAASSSATLQALIDACRKWDSKFEEWKDLNSICSIGESLQTCTLLMEWLQGDFYPIWHWIGGEVVRSVKPLILQKCRELLALVYCTLLLQVRFITANSQRLLDCYCLIYYKVLSVAQILDVKALMELIKAPECGMNPNRIRIGRLETTNDISAITRIPSIFAEIDQEETSLNQQIEAPILDKTQDYTPNQKIAVDIYEALILIFHLRVPAELLSSQGIPILPVQLLRDILITFPPSSVNKETVEFIKPLIDAKIDMNDQSGSIIKPWLLWMEEIVRWSDASIEMDPVKDLLRKSMDKIDHLRTIQRRYGLMFMD